MSEEGLATGGRGESSGPRYAIIGRVRKAHGLKGELVVEPVTTDPAAVFTAGRRVLVGNARGDLPDDAPSYTITLATPFKGGWIVGLDRLTDRNEAELWRERYIFAPYAELRPPADDEVYHHELLGMRVELATGEPAGEVVALYELPQGLTLEVARPGRSPALVPYRSAVVQRVDVGSRTIVLDPPEGLLD
jgi:16S rRNA processing protein RimM